MTDTTMQAEVVAPSDSAHLTFFALDAVRQIATSVSLADTSDDVIGLIDAVTASEGSVLTADYTFNGEQPDLAGLYSDGASASELAQALYSWLGPMSPVEASDNRLWSYLSCVTFQSFTKARWPLDTRSWQRRFDDRWVMKSASRNAMVRNSISRMWWGAHLTHDPLMQRAISGEAQDPFAYTAEIMRTEDLFLGVADRDVAACPNVLFALLDHFAAEPNRATEGYIRSLLVEFVAVSGYADIAGMSSEEATARIEAISTSLLRVPDADGAGVEPAPAL